MSEGNSTLEKNNSNGNENPNRNTSHEGNRGQRPHGGQRPYYQKRGYHPKNGQRTQRQNNYENKGGDKSAENIQKVGDEIKRESNTSNTVLANQNIAVGNANSVPNNANRHNGNNLQNRHNGKYQHSGHKDFNQRRKSSNVRVEETLDDIKLDIERIEKEIGLEIKEISALQFGV